MGSWEAKGYKIVAVDTTTLVCTGEEIGAAKKPVVKSKSWMPKYPPRELRPALIPVGKQGFKSKVC